MADFQAIITAILREGNVESQLAQLCRDRKVNIVANMEGNNASNVISTNASKAFASQGTLAAKSFNNAFTYSISKKSPSLKAFTDTFVEAEKDVSKRANSIKSTVANALSLNDSSAEKTSKQIVRKYDGALKAEARESEKAVAEADKLNRQHYAKLEENERKRIEAHNKKEQEYNNLWPKMETDYNTQKAKERQAAAQAEIDKINKYNKDWDAAIRENDARSAKSESQRKSAYTGIIKDQENLISQMDAQQANMVKHMSDPNLYGYFEKQYDSTKKAYDSNSAKLKMSYGDLYTNDEQLRLQTQLNRGAKTNLEIAKHSSAETKLQTKLQNEQRLISVRSQIEQMKQSAVLKNAHRNALVEQGKETINNLSVSQKELKNVQQKINTNEYGATSSKMSKRLSAYSNQDNEHLKTAKSHLDSYNQSIEKFSNHFSGKAVMTMKDFDSEVNKMTKSQKSFSNEMTIAGNETTKTLGRFDGLNKSNDILKYYNNNSRAAKKYGAQLELLASQASKANTTGELSGINQDFTTLKKQIDLEGLSGKSWIGDFKQSFSRIFQFANAYGMISKAQESISKSVRDLREIDTTLTEISKTSDLSSAELKALGDSSFETASKYGKTANDYLIGVQEMSRSGFYGTHAEDLAKTSILAQASGDMTADVANNYLLATNAAYEYQGSVQKLNAVLDGQNMITNRNSVNMTDMSEATSKAASMAAQTGVSIEELSAVIGTAVAKTKQNGNTIGTSLKSLFVNLQDTSNKKIVGTFKELGIEQTKFVNGSEQIKTPIELLRELADAYNSLPEGSALRADTLRNIGNKRQANVLAALLNGIGTGNFDKMLADYSEGTGSAAVEAEKSANNWQGNLNKLSNAFTSLVSNFANSDLAKGGLTSITGMVSGLDGVIKSFGSINTVLMGLSAIQTYNGGGKRRNNRICISYSRNSWATGKFSGDVNEIMLCA